MIINSVIKNEASRNSEMISQYEKLIAELPKGSLICRKNEYYYLKYRKNGKVCDDYVGKDKEKCHKAIRCSDKEKSSGQVGCLLGQIKKDRLDR